MLPPVLEIYVVWHPEDAGGAGLADELLRHFHGTAFTGLIGGAVEVYVRTAGWRGGGDDAPRPIPMPHLPTVNGVAHAQLTVVVPVLGNELAHAVQPGKGPWHEYALEILAGQRASPDRVAVFPMVLDRGAVEGTELGRLLNRFHGVGRGSAGDEPEVDRRCRDLSQAITQFAGDIAQERLTVFISHTNQPGHPDHAVVGDLIDTVRAIVGRTRLSEFFSTNALRVGVDWSEELTASAATSALLALRTDLYASRAWCQREMLVAKRAGMPVVVLDALGAGEERGSFLMDHVPRIPVRQRGGVWLEPDIRRGVNQLVDECLKRTLWLRQSGLAASRPDLGIDWWAPHAPEPVTLAAWLAAERAAGREPAGAVRILHPDPPLGPDEKSALDQIAMIGGLSAPLDILTPRSLAARGG
jgi:hypothetical protein